MVELEVSPRGRAMVAIVITAYILVVLSLVDFAIAVFVEGRPRQVLVFLGVALVVAAGVMVLAELALAASQN